MLTLCIDLYWSFRSPYSYILLPRIIDLQRMYNVTVDLRVVHPAALRNPAYFARMDPQARPYFLLDSARAARFHGLPFRRPVPDPVAQDPATLSIAADQPLALRLGRLGIAATDLGRGLDFAWEVAALLWGGQVNGWNDGAHLAGAAARAGLDLAVLDRAIAAPARFDQRLAENDTRLRAAGHWGVPTMVFQGEPFFGQDRFDMLLARLRDHDLSERTPQHPEELD